ncbi:hypothetical protein HDU84_006220 [Entophlyctis sp. JEL0112]|nr:hypothetical protein HDU84_006220 [Entophlyctis sp. JEL0112]
MAAYMLFVHIPGVVAVDFARQTCCASLCAKQCFSPLTCAISDNVPYPQPDDSAENALAKITPNVPCSLHITHLPPNYTREEILFICQDLAGDNGHRYQQIQYYGKYCYATYATYNHGYAARNTLRDTTNLVVTFAKPKPIPASDTSFAVEETSNDKRQESIGDGVDRKAKSILASMVQTATPPSNFVECSSNSLRRSSHTYGKQHPGELHSDEFSRPQFSERHSEQLNIMPLQTKQDAESTLGLPVSPAQSEMDRNALPSLGETLPPVQLSDAPFSFANLPPRNSNSSVVHISRASMNFNTMQSPLVQHSATKNLGLEELIGTSDPCEIALLEETNTSRSSCRMPLREVVRLLGMTFSSPISKKLDSRFVDVVGRPSCDLSIKPMKYGFPDDNTIRLHSIAMTKAKAFKLF